MCAVALLVESIKGRSLQSRGRILHQGREISVDFQTVDWKGWDGRRTTKT
jgi:hypothetical protein